MPSDRTGENPYWESEEPYYDDFYTLWVSLSNLFRSVARPTFDFTLYPGI